MKSQGVEGIAKNCLESNWYSPSHQRNHVDIQDKFNDLKQKKKKTISLKKLQETKEWLDSFN